VLLLEQLLKKTRSDHPDKEPLEQAIVVLKKLGKDINTKKGESMKLQAVIDLQPKLSSYPSQKLGDLIHPERLLALFLALLFSLYKNLTPHND